jgi:hypothetical protein
MSYGHLVAVANGREPLLDTDAVDLGRMPGSAERVAAARLAVTDAAPLPSIRATT